MVLTVPSDYSIMQTESLRRVATDAGFNVVRIIPDVAAIALSYQQQNKKVLAEKEQNVLVIDFGAGSFSCAIACVDEEDIELRAIDGNCDLGGEDLDDALLEYIVQDFKKTKGKDISQNVRAMKRMRTAVEKAKKALSTAQSTYIEIYDFVDGADYYSQLTRAKLEEVCMDHLKKAKEPLERLF